MDATRKNLEIHPRAANECTMDNSSEAYYALRNHLSSGNREGVTRELRATLYTAQQAGVRRQEIARRLSVGAPVVTGQSSVNVQSAPVDSFFHLSVEPYLSPPAPLLQRATWPGDVAIRLDYPNNNMITCYRCGFSSNDWKTECSRCKASLEARPDLPRCKKCRFMIEDPFTMKKCPSCNKSFKRWKARA